MSVWPELANRRYGEYPKGKYRDNGPYGNYHESIDADFTIIEEKPLLPKQEGSEVKGTVKRTE